MHWWMATGHCRVASLPIWSYEESQFGKRDVIHRRHDAQSLTCARCVPMTFCPSCLSELWTHHSPTICHKIVTKFGGSQRATHQSRVCHTVQYSYQSYQSTSHQFIPIPRPPRPTKFRWRTARCHQVLNDGLYCHIISSALSRRGIWRAGMTWGKWQWWSPVHVNVAMQ